MQNINETIAKHKIVPVIKLNRAQDALPLAQALIDGGLPVAEITFRTAAAPESIAKVAAQYPNMLVGAGTVTNLTQAQQALDAGAKFVVTPGISRTVTEFCLKKGLPLFAGACTPGEIMTLLEYGLDIAKFFPCAQFGGLATIKALAGPFPQMHFMPTGGISSKNVLEYLAFGKIIACGGSWMVKEDLIDAGRYDDIRQMVAQAVALVQGS